jgi:hypothetical protein
LLALSSDADAGMSAHVK